MSLNVARDPPLKTLDMRGPRGALTAEKAAEFVAPITSKTHTDYQRVILSTWAFSLESAAVVARALEQLHPSLQSIVMADIIAGRPEAEGLEVYRILSASLQNARALKEIDLSDNAMGVKGVDACADVLKNRTDTLERLFFCNCGISAEAARVIADVMMTQGAAGSTTGSSNTTALRVLHFDNNMSGNPGAIAISDLVRASPQLENFRFSSSRGGRDGGIALAKAFTNTPRLRVLDLHDNSLAEVTGVALGVTVRSLHHLVHLDVGDTLLKDEGAAALASGLVRGCCDVLEVLDVSANELTAEGAKSIARCVRRLKKLKVLRAQENEFENEGIEYIAQAIHRRPAFRTLAFAKGAKKEVRVVTGAAAATAAVIAVQTGAGASTSSAVATSSTTTSSSSSSTSSSVVVSEGTDTELQGNNVDPLIEINVSENMFASKGARMLAKACGAHLKGLKKLEMGGNEFTTATVAAVRSALESGGLIDVLGDVDEEDGDDEEEKEDGIVDIGADDAESDIGEEEAPTEDGEKPDSAVDALANELANAVSV